jgi:hypothetical protein
MPVYASKSLRERIVDVARTPSVMATSVVRGGDDFMIDWSTNSSGTGNCFGKPLRRRTGVSGGRRGSMHSRTGTKRHRDASRDGWYDQGDLASHRAWKSNVVSWTSDVFRNNPESLWRQLWPNNVLTHQAPSLLLIKRGIYV